MANAPAWCFITDNYFVNTTVIDREFDLTPDNDNDLEPYSVKSCSPRDSASPIE